MPRRRRVLPTCLSAGLVTAGLVGALPATSAWAADPDGTITLSQTAAQAVALGPDRAGWIDDGTKPYAAHERTLTGAGPSLAAGQARTIPNVPKGITYVGSTPMGLAMSGDRDAWSPQDGALHTYVEGQAADQVTTISAAPTSLSGRWVLGSSSEGPQQGPFAYDLASHTRTWLPSQALGVQLWGRRAAYTTSVHDLHVRDVVAGTDTVVVTAPAAGSPQPTFALWGDTVAWHDGSALHWKDLTTGDSATIPATSAGPVSLSGSYVGYVDMTSHTAHIYPLQAGVTTATLDLDDVRSLSLDGSRAAWVDQADGLPKVLALPQRAEAPRWLGDQRTTPADWTTGGADWAGEWTFTQPLTACAVVLRLGSTVERSLPCGGGHGTVTASWDGLDAAGRWAPSGTYTWTVEATGTTGTTGTDAPVTGPDGTGAVTGSLLVHSVHRLGGADRYATAAAVSSSTFPTGAPVAYVANGLTFPDALSGAPAAAHTGGPVLLTAAGSLPAATAAELARLKPGRIVVLGSTGAVSAAVATKLKGYTTGTVTRLAGSDRFGTSAAVSRATYAVGAPVAYVANGLSYPDALAGAPAAGRQGGPVLLTQSGSLPSAIATELARLKPQRIVVLGGTGAVSAAVATRLKGFTTGTVTRLAGADRYATAVAISQATATPGVESVHVASASGFADALAGGAAAGLAGITGGPLLLVDSGSAPTSVHQELNRLNPKRAVVLGGAGAVADSWLSQLATDTP